MRKEYKEGREREGDIEREGVEEEFGEKGLTERWKRLGRKERKEPERRGGI
jgi:hypothetical protein